MKKHYIIIPASQIDGHVTDIIWECRDIQSIVKATINQDICVTLRKDRENLAVMSYTIREHDKLHYLNIVNHRDTELISEDFAMQMIYHWAVPSHHIEEGKVEQFNYDYLGNLRIVTHQFEGAGYDIYTEEITKDQLEDILAEAKRLS